MNQSFLFFFLHQVCEGGQEGENQMEINEMGKEQSHTESAETPLTDEVVERRLEETGQHPIFSPFEQYILSREANLINWKTSSEGM